MLHFISSIWIVAQADLKMFFRYPASLVSTLVWPLLFAGSAILVARGLAGPDDAGTEVFAAATGTADYVSYLLLGNVLFAIINTCLWGGGLSMSQARQQGVLETHWLLPGRGLPFVFGKTLSSILQQFLPSFLLLWVAHSLELLAFKTTLFAVALLVLVSLPFLLGALVLFATLTLRVVEGGYVILSLRTIIALICGISFPLSVLPDALEFVGRWFPVTRMLDIFRRLAIFGDPLSSHTDSLLYIFVSGVVTILLALWVFRGLEIKVRRAGLLGGY